MFQDIYLFNFNITMNTDLKNFHKICHFQLNFPVFPMKNLLHYLFLLCDYLKILMLKRFNNKIAIFFLFAFLLPIYRRINEKRFSLKKNGEEKENEKLKQKQKYKDIYGLLGVTEIDIFIAFSKTEYISKFSTNPCGKIGGSW